MDEKVEGVQGNKIPNKNLINKGNSMVMTRGKGVRRQYRGLKRDQRRLGFGW